MRQQDRTRRTGLARTGGRWALLAGAALLSTTGCTAAVNEDVTRGWLPTQSDTTTTTNISETLWVGSWVAALAVGVVVWGLIIWCAARYRRRKGDTGLPPQLRYNVPLEILYTLVPLFMVGVLFYFTARDQTILETRYEDPAVNVEVVAKRWAWDLNYTDADVYDAGIQAAVDENGIQEDVPDTIPVLYLPVGQPADITLRSRDVIHDFYVPAFSYKKDVIPGRTNYMEVTPTREGVFIGRCAELCGEGHSRMLFKVAVVSQAEYEQHLDDLRTAGQTGALPATNGPSALNPNLQEDSVGEDQGGQSADAGSDG